MTEIMLVILSALLPILTISAFIIGYNMNTTRKLFKKKEERTMLERIDDAKIY